MTLLHEGTMREHAMLEVADLHVALTSGGVTADVVDGVDFTLDAGRTIGLIGESGSGKTMTAMSVVRLLPEGARTAGAVSWNGQDVLHASERELRALRGHEIAVIFQDPLVALNPTQRVGDQIGEILRRAGVRRAETRRRVLALMMRVGIPDAERRQSVYPHELSGGLRQRVVIAMALAGEPRVIIADEPTTALDVTTQARILELLEQLSRDEGMAMILVSHDLRVVARVADEVVVMYAGRVAEVGPAAEVLSRARHPYTRALMRNVPAVSERGAIAEPLPGAPATPFARPEGCAFHPRCPMAQEVCRRERPALRWIADGRRSACHFAEEVPRD
ncbi:MAG: ABC transporter ATP-binding protein [Microbacterium sp.]